MSAAPVRLILLPGLDGSGVLFAPMLKHLAPEVEPVIVRYPPDRALGYEELLPTVLAALPSGSPFVLVAESFSGPLALMCAARRPAGLIGVVLCASFIRNPVWRRPGWLRHLVRPFVFRLYPKLSLARGLLVGRSSPELRRLIAEALAPLRPEVLAHRVRSVLGVDVTKELLARPVPILYLRATRDVIVPAHNAAEIVAMCPSVRVVEIPAPHAVLQTQPAASVAAIVTFVRDLARPDAVS
ncbi:MAG TPA: alpha/beta hydrolase [Tepidisphaeraceae bacterium]|jgi:pimeloyl-ACP methyl ester carboxylesterase